MQRHLTRLGLVLAGASALAGCFLLSPDDPQRTTLQLHIVARDAGVGKSPPCQPAVDLLATDDLVAEARILRDTTPDDDGDTPEVVARTNLVIGDLVDGERELTGELEFDVGAAGAAYFIEVDLDYTGVIGRDPLGTYTGDLIAFSGVVVHVDSLQVKDDLGAGEYGGEVKISFGSDSTTQVFPNPDTSPPTPAIRYDARTNRLTYEYHVEDVDWNGESRNVVVKMVAGFGPTTIYHAFQELPELSPGQEIVDQDVVLTPVEDPKVHLAVKLSGEIRVAFEDGRPPSETAQLRLARVSEPCD